MHQLREALQNIQLLEQKGFLLVFLRFHSPFPHQGLLVSAG